MSYCGDGCISTCTNNSYLLSILIINGLESARVYHEKGDTIKRDAILEKLADIIANQELTDNEGTSVQVDLDEYNLTFANEIYKYSLSELYGIECYIKTLKELTNKQLILKILDINNALQYLSETSVDCLESKININNCNC